MAPGIIVSGSESHGREIWQGTHGASDSMLVDCLVLVMRVRFKVLNSAASGWRVYFPKLCTYTLVSFVVRTAHMMLYRSSIM